MRRPATVTTRQAGAVPDHDAAADRLARRIERLRHELGDEGVRLPADPRLTELLLVELDYARHPSFHEGVGPRFGAMLTDRPLGITHDAGLTSVIDCAGRDVGIVRRLADGRSS